MSYMLTLVGSSQDGEWGRGSACGQESTNVGGGACRGPCRGGALEVEVGFCIREGRAACWGGHTHLSENKLPIHVHGQVSKVQKHLVSGQLLLYDIIPVDGHDGHADEKVEVICLGGREWVQIRPLTQPWVLTAGRGDKQSCGVKGSQVRPSGFVWP